MSEEKTFVVTITGKPLQLEQLWGERMRRIIEENLPFYNLKVDVKESKSN